MEKITVLCAASDKYWPFMELTEQNRKEYCQLYGYDLVLRKHRECTKSFHVEREEFMLEELLKTDWLLFMGVDTCFTNFNIKILDIIKDAKEIPDVTWAFCKEGVSGIPGLNNDVMLFKNTPRSVKFLESVMSLENEAPNDQAAMYWLLSPKQLQISKLKSNPVPQKVFNAMPQWLYRYDPALKVNGIWDGQWEAGDFIFHAPGLPLPIRYNLIKTILTKVLKPWSSY